MTDDIYFGKLRKRLVVAQQRWHLSQWHVRLREADPITSWDR